MERLMQYVWQHRLYSAMPMTDVCGRRIDVIDPGLINTGSGPDFFNAKIKIDNHVWVGNVEIHVRASDWRRHGHQHDHAYDSVVLHVVGVDDERVHRPDGAEIPQLLMRCNPDLRSHYDALVGARPDAPACSAHLRDISPLHLSDWMTALAVERLYRKADRVAELARHFGGDWTAAVYVVLARALGFGTNAEPFERLALATPLRVLLKHADNVQMVEALLFGQSGLLDAVPDNEYCAALRRDYAFLRSKYGLSPIDPVSWRCGRIRPQNLPYRRIALLAAHVAGGFHAGYDIFDATTVDGARRIFAVPPSEYWQNRYTFGSACDARVPRVLSESSLISLIINVVVPTISAYGRAYGRQDMHQRATDLLMALPPENNAVVRAFTDAGVPCRDAFASQALIELRRSFCDSRKCLYCRLGHRILASKAIIHHPQ